jgi:hypothetical protein
MGITALTFGFPAVASSTLATANALTTATGTGGLTSTATTVGTATGFGPLYSQGTTQAWPSLLALADPSGHGWVLDSTVLEQQNIPGGVWSGSLPLVTSAGTVTADVYVRIGVYHSATGVYTLLGSLVAPGVTLQTSWGSGAVTFSGTLSAASLTTGDKLYADVWLNITSNSTGSSSATVSVGNLATTLYITNAWTAPGYQPLTEAQRSIAYRYGGFVLHDLINYVLIQKEYDFPQVRQTYFKIARAVGMKKTGEVVNEQQIPVQVQVIGTSRADLEMKLDALYGALNQRQQALTLHSIDGRYWVADAIVAKAPLPPGKIVSTLVPVTFVAQQPYALAATASAYTWGAAALSLVSGTTWQTGSIVIAGGGNATAPCSITITNTTALNTVTLTAALTQNTNYTALSVSALPAALANGTWLYISNGTTTQHVQLSAAAAQGATTLSVVSFTANANYAATSSTVFVDTYITGVTYTQNPDGTTLTVSNLGTSLGNGGTLTVDSDYTTQNGYTVIANNSGTPLPFTGTFPVIEPGQTTFNLQVICNNQPTLTVAFSWTPHWLS